MPTPQTVAKAWPYSNRVRVGAALLAGVLAGVASLALHLRPLAPLLGWDAAAAVYVVWVFSTVFRLKEDTTEGLASSEDPDGFSADAIVLLASLASLLAVGVTLLDAGKEEGADKTILVVTSVVSVVLSWLAVHTAYTLRYARLYYDDCAGGIDFNDEKGKPSYLDFAYFAFTIGMTFQVSDTEISDRRIRGTVLRHALLAYLFGTVIVATTINLVAGLSK